MLNQCQGEEIKYGAIDSLEELNQNLKSNSIPESTYNMNIENYDSFLLARRELMSQKMKDYYYNL